MLFAKILFILAGWFYFIFEGLTETEVSTYFKNRYHKRRLLEMLGIVFSFHIVFIVAGMWDWILLFWVGIGIGLPIYEFSFRKEKYGSYFAEKTGHWLGIPHPPIWAWIGLFLVSLFLLIIIL